MPGTYKTGKHKGNHILLTYNNLGTIVYEKDTYIGFLCIFLHYDICLNWHDFKSVPGNCISHTFRECLE